MKKMWFPLLAGGLFLVSCSEGVDEAKQSVDEFRTAVSNKSYAEIYRAADEQMRASGTEAEFVEFMSAVERKLGPWQSAPDPIWTATSGSWGHQIILNYQSQFANGSATETFTWRVVKGKAVLNGYHVDSPLLVTK
jgi:hypothetical protein